jgi:hypothetical protein
MVYEVLLINANKWMGHDMHKYNVSLVKLVGRALEENTISFG